MQASKQVLKDRASYVLMQDKIRLVFTTALYPHSDIADHVKKHGDGVKVVALWVDDARKSFEETVKRGAKPYFEPRVEEDEHGKVVRSGIHTTAIPFTFLLNGKITKDFSSRDTKNGNRFTDRSRSGSNMLTIWWAMLTGGK
jgi:4-hydroxyphenylpyruvate dioxygenase-like putative hemolysin